MKICFCVAGMHAGGAERVVSNLANFMSKDNEVYIVMVSSLENKTFYKLDGSIQLLCVNKGKRTQPFKRLLTLRKLLLNINPDVVISFLPHVNVYVHFALLGKKIVHIVSERNDPKQTPQNILLRILKHHSFKKADGCVFQTQYSLDFFKKIPNDKKIIIYNPLFLNTDVIFEKGKTKNRIITVGRLVEQKNQKELIRVFSKFIKIHPNFKLDIFGEGPLLDELIDFCCSLNMEQYVSFKGVSSNWHNKINDYDFFVLPSKFEGMPNALLEAMSLGIPCISSDCPAYGAREFITDGENGLLYQVNDDNGLLEAMNNILVTNINDNKYLIDKLNIEVIAEQWINFINEILERKR